MRHNCHVRPSLCGAILSALSLLILPGCGGDGGGGCTYSSPVTGTVTVIAAEAPTANAPKASGQPCSSFSYTWTTGGPSSFPNFDRFFSTDACAAAANLRVGTTFQVTRQDETAGTCTPSIRQILNQAISGCNAACM